MYSVNIDVWYSDQFGVAVSVSPLLFIALVCLDIAFKVMVFRKLVKK